MKKTKAIAVYIAATVLLLPTILVINESGPMLPNYIGLAYLVGLVALSRTKLGKKAIQLFLDAAKALGIDTNE